MIQAVSTQKLPGPLGESQNELQKFTESPFSYMEECAQKYGDIFQLPFAVGGDPMPTVILSHPDALQVLYKPSSLQYFENQKIS
jgi:cytochrome P450